VYNIQRMNDQPPEITNPIFETAEASKKSSPVVRFFKKHKLITALISAVIIASITISVLLFTFIPVVDMGSKKFVSADTTVRIEKDQTVKLKYTNVSVKVQNFSNNVCPAGQQCYGSNAEPTVEYLMTIGDKKVATGTSTNKPVEGYQIKTIDSDYKTYAEIKILKSN